jgi:hypothetical protein
MAAERAATLGVEIAAIDEFREEGDPLRSDRPRSDA